MKVETSIGLASVDVLLRDGFLRAASRLALPVICVLPVLLFVPFLMEPFEGDEGVYATIAKGLLRGEVPYRDYFDHKPPLVYVYYAFSFLAFGEGIAAPRLLASLFLSATTLLVYKEARLVLNSSSGATLAAAAFALSTGFTLLQPNSNTEVFLLLPMTASLWAFSKGLQDRGIGWFAAAGVCCGLAVLTKHVAVWNAAALALGCLALGADAGVATRLRRLCGLVAGGLSVLLLAVVPFALAGAFDELLYANVTYNLLYSGQLTLAERLDRLVATGFAFLVVSGPLVVAAVPAIPVIASRRSNDLHRIVGVWFCASLVGVATSGFFYPHYYLTLLPGLALCTGIGLSGYQAWTGRGRASFLAALGLAALLCIALNGTVYLASSPDERHLLKYPRQPAEWHVASMDLARYIAASTEPEDTILNYGRESQLYFYADRPPALRFIYNRPFWLDSKTFDEAMQALREAPPTMIIDTASFRGDVGWEEDHPTVLRDFLTAEYDFVGHVEFADIYSLKQTP
jgi:4-amino-4-deoxy-L-arabinose transferase-like glycosyltransferase